MNKKLMLLLLSFVLLGGLVSAALTREDFTNLQLSNNLGTVDDFKGHITINVQKGWNILPLKFIAEASGRYWGNFKEGQTCEQDIFQNVWYYSPVSGGYYHLPNIDDWRFPVSRNNNVLLTEFQNKYYHIYAGSGWIYSSKACILEGDEGVGLISMNYGGETGVGYNYNELNMKAGWNFIPVDYLWSGQEMSLREVFSDCGMEKLNIWDSQNQKWTYDSAQMNNISYFALDEKIAPSMVFKTLLVKTGKDCYLAKNVIDGASQGNPPSLP